MAADGKNSRLMNQIPDPGTRAKLRCIEAIQAIVKHDGTDADQC